MSTLELEHRSAGRHLGTKQGKVTHEGQLVLLTSAPALPEGFHPDSTHRIANRGIKLATSSDTAVITS